MKTIPNQKPVFPEGSGYLPLIEGPRDRARATAGSELLRDHLAHDLSFCLVDRALAAISPSASVTIQTLQEAQLLVEGRDMLLISADAVECLCNDDVEVTDARRLGNPRLL